MSIEETLAKIDSAFGPKPWAVKQALVAVVKSAANLDGPDDWRTRSSAQLLRPSRDTKS